MYQIRRWLSEKLPLERIKMRFVRRLFVRLLEILAGTYFNGNKLSVF